MHRGSLAKAAVAAIVVAAFALLAAGCAGNMSAAATSRQVERRIVQAVSGVNPTVTEGVGSTRTYALPNWSRVRVQQREPVWCWAACAEMAHRYGGTRVTQEQIAKRIKGRAGDGTDADLVQTAQEIECLAALEPQAYERARARDEANSRRFAQVQEQHKDAKINWQPVDRDRTAPDLNYDPDQLVADLSERRPVIVGLGVRSEADSEHVVVVHAAEVQQAARSGGGGPQLVRFGPDPKHHVVRATYTDPDTGQDVTVTGAELARRADFMASRQRAREYFDYLAATDWTYTVEPDKDGSKRKAKNKRKRPDGGGNDGARPTRRADNGVIAADPRPGSHGGFGGPGGAPDVGLSFRGPAGGQRAGPDGHEPGAAAGRANAGARSSAPRKTAGADPSPVAGGQPQGQKPNVRPQAGQAVPAKHREGGPAGQQAKAVEEQSANPQRPAKKGAGNKGSGGGDDDDGKKAQKKRK